MCVRVCVITLTLNIGTAAMRSEGISLQTSAVPSDEKEQRGREKETDEIEKQQSREKIGRQDRSGSDQGAKESPGRLKDV